MYEHLFAYLLGAFLAAVVIYPTSHLAPERQRRFLTAVLAVVILGFFGFPLVQGDSVGLAWELTAVVVLGALLLMSQRIPGLLALAWFGHGLWDLMFLLGIAPVDKPIWVCELCVPFDWLVAGYLATRLERWRRASA